MPQRQIHRESFLASNGFGPWPCFRCGILIHFLEVFVVHHLDHDPTNNAQENLVAGHHACHIGHHASVRGMSTEHARKIGDANRGRKNAGVSASNRLRKGQKRSATTKAKMSIAQRRRYSDPAERAKTSEAIRAVGHQISESGKRRFTDPAQRERQAEAQRCRYADPAEHEKSSEAMRRWWAKRKATTSVPDA